MKRFSALVGILAVLALVAPGMALASSTCQGYGSKACDSVSSGTAGTGNGSTTATTSSGSLPFTGLDIVLLVVGGGALLTGGFVVRRLSRRLN
jgi:hypothetical protein